MNMKNSSAIETANMVAGATAKKYDKTIVCKIISLPVGIGKPYIVEGDGMRFYATVLSSVKDTFKIGDNVSVLIPESNYSKEKTITGKYFTADDIPAQSDVLHVSDGYSAAWTYTHNAEISFPKLDTITQTADIITDGNPYNQIHPLHDLPLYLNIQADIQSDYSKDFGLKFNITYSDYTEETDIYYIQPQWSSNQMVGNTSQFFVPFHQEIVLTLRDRDKIQKYYDEEIAKIDSNLSDEDHSKEQKRLEDECKQKLLDPMRYVEKITCEFVGSKDTSAKGSIKITNLVISFVYDKNDLKDGLYISVPNDVYKYAAAAQENGSGDSETTQGTVEEEVSNSTTQNDVTTVAEEVVEENTGDGTGDSDESTPSDTTTDLAQLTNPDKIELVYVVNKTLMITNKRYIGKIEDISYKDGTDEENSILKVLRVYKNETEKTATYFRFDDLLVKDENGAIKSRNPFINLVRIKETETKTETTTETETETKTEIWFELDLPAALDAMYKGEGSTDKLYENSIAIIGPENYDNKYLYFPQGGIYRYNSSYVNETQVPVPLFKTYWEEIGKFEFHDELPETIFRAVICDDSGKIINDTQATFYNDLYEQKVETETQTLGLTLTSTHPNYLPWFNNYGNIIKPQPITITAMRSDVQPFGVKEQYITWRVDLKQHFGFAEDIRIYVTKDNDITTYYYYTSTDIEENNKIYYGSQEEALTKLKPDTTDEGTLEIPKGYNQVNEGYLYFTKKIVVDTNTKLTQTIKIVNNKLDTTNVSTIFVCTHNEEDPRNGDFYLGYGSIDFTLGFGDTNGTGYGFVIVPSDYKVFSSDETEKTYTAVLYNKDGQKETLDESKIKWSWMYGLDNQINKDENGQIISATDMYYYYNEEDNKITVKYNNTSLTYNYYILVATLKGWPVSDGKTVDLRTYMPMIIGPEGTNIGDITGTTRLIFDTTGNLYQQDGQGEQYGVGGTSYEATLYRNEGSTAIDSKTLYISNNQLISSGFNPLQSGYYYTINMTNNNKTIHMPLMITTNTWFSGVLNEWGGGLTIDEKGNYILTAAVVAGEMTSNNTFNGVMMGSVANSLNWSGAKPGLYGFHNGVNTFNFKSNDGSFMLGEGAITYSADESTVILDSGVKINWSSGTDSSGVNKPDITAELDDLNVAFKDDIDKAEARIKSDLSASLDDLDQDDGVIRTFAQDTNPMDIWYWRKGIVNEDDNTKTYTYYIGKPGSDDKPVNWTVDDDISAFPKTAGVTIKTTVKQSEENNTSQPTIKDINANKALHEGDMWTCTADNNTPYKKGQTYEWERNDNNELEWQEIPVNDTIKGLINNKSKIWTTKPTDGDYNIGDMWILQNNYSENGDIIYKAGDILYCTQDPSSTFSINDWSPPAIFGSLQDDINQLDGKFQTYYQRNDPSEDDKGNTLEEWQPSEDGKKSIHEGDLWIELGTTTIKEWEDDTTPGKYEWVEVSSNDALYRSIVNNATIWTKRPGEGDVYKYNDLWMLEKDYTEQNKYYKKGVTLYCTTQGFYAYNDSKFWTHWSLPEVFETIQDDMNQPDQRIRTFMQDDNPMEIAYLYESSTQKYYKGTIINGNEISWKTVLTNKPTDLKQAGIYMVETTKPTTSTINWSDYEGDIWTCTSDNSTQYKKGATYEWEDDGNSETYEWVEVQVISTETANAIANKNTIHVTDEDEDDNSRNKLPNPPYKKGDIWVNPKGEYYYDGGYVEYKDGDIAYAQTDRISGNPTIEDWIKPIFGSLTDDILSQTKIETHTQEQPPNKYDKGNNELTDAAKAEWFYDSINVKSSIHEGDLWYCTKDFIDNNITYKANITYEWDVTSILEGVPQYSWIESITSKEIQKAIENKGTIFTSKPDPGSYKIGDLWIDGEEFRWCTKTSGATADSDFTLSYDSLSDQLEEEMAQQDGKISVYSQDSDPKDEWLVVGKTYWKDSSSDKYWGWSASGWLGPATSPNITNLKNLYLLPYAPTNANSVYYLHDGDTWTCTADIKGSDGTILYEKDGKYEWVQKDANTDGSWVQVDNSYLTDLIGKKGTIFTTSSIPTPPYKKGDVWIPSNDVVENEEIIFLEDNIYYANKNTTSGNGNKGDWSTAKAMADVEDLEQFKTDVETALGIGTNSTGKDYIISPKIGGGYLYLKDKNGNNSVEIDPSGTRIIDENDNVSNKIFNIKHNGQDIMSVTTDQGATIAGWNINDNSFFGEVEDNERIYDESISEINIITAVKNKVSINKPNSNTDKIFSIERNYTQYNPDDEEDGASGSIYPFYVTTRGVVYAEKATISGTVVASAGKIGGIQINTDSNGGIKANNFSITSDGTATFKSGNIAGWTFNENYFYKTKDGYSIAFGFSDLGEDSRCFKIGKFTDIDGEWGSYTEGFQVTGLGKLYATGAVISGDITATSGTFNNCTINDTCKIAGTLISNDEDAGLQFSLQDKNLDYHQTKINQNGFSYLYKESSNDTIIGEFSVIDGSNFIGPSLTFNSIQYDLENDVQDGVRLYANPTEGVGIWFTSNSISNGIVINANGAKFENNVSVSTFIANDSDINLKNKIEPLSSNYTTLFDNLNPVRYKYNSGTSNRYHTGFIAQDLQQAIIDAGLTEQEVAALCTFKDSETESHMAIRYEELIALCVNEIQKLKSRVNDLEIKENITNEQQ